MKPIKAVGVQIIPDAIASPSLSSTRIRRIAFSVGPAHPQVSGLSSNKVVHLVNYQLKIPLLILSRTLCHAQKNVWPHAADNKPSKY